VARDGYSEEAIMTLDLALRDLVRDVLRGELRAILQEELRATRPDPPATKVTKDYLTVREAAEVASKKEPTIREWIKRGLLHASRPAGGREYLIRQTDLIRCIGGLTAVPDAVDVESEALKVVGRLRGA
jgi:excisionase family DNA binding protein